MPTLTELPDHPGYGVTPDGRVWSRWVVGHHRLGSEWRELRGGVGSHGYRQVDLQGHKLLVHRLVLECFVGPCPEGMEACHADGDITNNTLSNLRWCTSSENSADSVAHGTSPRDRSATAKLNPEAVRRIRNDPRSARKAAPDYGVSHQLIQQVRARKAWAHI